MISIGDGASALAGKRVLVTGGNTGIGRPTALAFARAGARVAAAWFAAPEMAESLVTEARGFGATLVTARADLSQEPDVLALFSTVLPVLGGLDVVVNNAGVLLEKPLLMTTAADFDRVMGVNLRGTFLVGREAIRAMGPGGGRVINIASDLAYGGREAFSVYCASKAAVLSLTRSWAREFAPQVLVNAICPGPTDTAMLDAASMSPEWREKELAIPLRRFAQPEEIARSVLFLAGPGGDYMTGQALHPNGGSVMP